MCYTSVRLTEQWVCLQQRHHKHVNDVLRCYFTMVTMSLGDRNFSAPLPFPGPLSSMWSVIDQNIISGAQLYAGLKWAGLHVIAERHGKL